MDESLEICATVLCDAVGGLPMNETKRIAERQEKPRRRPRTGHTPNTDRAGAVLLLQPVAGARREQ